MDTTINFRWLNDPVYANEIAQLLINNLEADYISHSEILIGRSVDEDQWADELPEIIQQEIKAIFEKTDPDLTLAVVNVEEKIKGVCIIRLVETKKNKIWIIEDIIVDKNIRSMGIGTTFLKWVETEAKIQGVNMLLCESGNHNYGAHDFFTGNGYKPLSQTFLKKI